MWLCNRLLLLQLGVVVVVVALVLMFCLLRFRLCVLLRLFPPAAGEQLRDSL